MSTSSPKLPKDFKSIHKILQIVPFITQTNRFLLIELILIFSSYNSNCCFKKNRSTNIQINKLSKAKNNSKENKKCLSQMNIRKIQVQLPIEKIVSECIFLINNFLIEGELHEHLNYAKRNST